jgi:molecular chaperone HtpG
MTKTKSKTEGKTKSNTKPKPKTEGKTKSNTKPKLKTKSNTKPKTEGKTKSNTKPKTGTTETHAFQAETRQILQLMIHSLYSNKEIFLRELISNSSDALDRLRFEAIQDDSIYEGDTELYIEIEMDEEAGTLTVRDNGTGMNREEVMENIGTIAKSGTRAFLDRLSGDQKADAQIIGQFGVGFYSAFIVADKVTLLSRKAGEAAKEAVRWESDGGGKFSIETVDREAHGTEVTLHLKEAEKEFLSKWTVRSLISRYSDHIGFPIRMPSETIDSEAEDSKAENSEAQWEDVNKASALWTLPKKKISDEEYQSFYKYLTHDMEDAQSWAHNKVEGSQCYTTLLYVPTNAPMDLMLQRDERTGLRLYVNRVFIMDAAQSLLPHYLRFIRGVVDSSDLPLNVSRELLQENELLAKIRSAVTRRSLDMIGKIAKDDSEQYKKFWLQFGAVIKEGVAEDFTNRDRIAALLRFASTHANGADASVSLDQYKERMKEGQEAIYFITAENHLAASNSPHLEVFRKNGIEVLLMSDRVDEWMMAYFTEFDETPFKSVAKGDIDLGALKSADADDSKEDGDSKDSEESSQSLDADLLKKIQDNLSEQVSEVRSSKRLTDSASCLVLGEQEMALHLQKLLEQAGQAVPGAQPVLELNAAHPLVQLLQEQEGDEEFSDLSLII